jgi:FkbM family methyltransferase
MIASPLLKRVAARLPESLQHELRRLFFHGQIRRGKFFTDESEYALLERLLRPGDWALDIGANVGHYTMRMAQLVGPTGRVIAIEPVSDTFALLAENSRHFAYSNVSLLNIAASDRTSIVSMDIPLWPNGAKNYYQAHLVCGSDGQQRILTLELDALALPQISLVKIDAEGHELPVLRGMHRILERDHPTVIVETSAPQVADLLKSLDYRIERLAGSSNLLCQFGELRASQ